MADMNAWKEVEQKVATKEEGLWGTSCHYGNWQVRTI